MADKDAPIYKQAGQDGRFRRQVASFRSTISRSPGADFPPAKDRYVLYVTYGCHGPIAPTLYAPSKA
ncbi:hypothetical protein CIHG_03286 [Coccidioides immitis H538.4]|uniref:Uncharacterized protein n=1 Tax=Coccidioides immitis H538.4 TaxID=396776 RepID=A0A0J8UDW8_COCIT|nr:hypothetical protein CIHG_03286 [Coccidioides immitis H538.4]